MKLKYSPSRKDTAKCQGTVRHCSHENAGLWIFSWIGTSFRKPMSDYSRLVILYLGFQGRNATPIRVILTTLLLKVYKIISFNYHIRIRFGNYIAAHPPNGQIFPLKKPCLRKFSNWSLLSLRNWIKQGRVWVGISKLNALFGLLTFEWRIQKQFLY